MALIELRDISFSYKGVSQKAVQNINITIDKGQFTLIMGHDGSGKSTIGYLLKGLIPNVFDGVLEGKQILNQKDFSQYSHKELTSKIGYVFQDPLTQLSMIKNTVFDELAFSCENLGFDPKESRFRVKAIARLLGISEILQKHPLRISLGQLQTVALGSCLVLDPDIVILDEPTSQLDPVTRTTLFNNLKDLKKQGKTIIIMEHHIDEVLDLVDQVVILDEGQIYAQGSVKNVFTKALEENKDIQYPSWTKLISMVSPLQGVVSNQSEAINYIKEVLIND